MPVKTTGKGRLAPFRPHRQSAVLGTAYRYHYCEQRGLCVRHRKCSAKTVEPIKSLFERYTRVSPKNDVLDGGSRFPYIKWYFEGQTARSAPVKYGDSLMHIAQRGIIHCRITPWQPDCCRRSFNAAILPSAAGTRPATCGPLQNHFGHLFDSQRATRPVSARCIAMN